jgi:NAD(P)-dependent dehydrogenase (short-subunit alcohol dehydrogenase family)
MTFKRNILVIGASRGIGKELVIQLAKDPSTTVLACSRDLDKMTNAFQGLSNVSSFHLDLSKENVKEDLEKIIETVDRIDFMVNNAGYLVNKPFTELTSSDIELSYRVNVQSIMLCVQATLKKMEKGHIVNISSMGGFQGSVKFPGLAAYSTSKAALCSFTELFAEEYKGTGIQMNCLCLGAVQTEMLEEAFPGYIAPMSAAEMANFIADFLLTKHKWMNGKIIPVSLSTP